MNSQSFKLIDLWCPDETYTNHRIPGMIVTKKGTLIVYCEARRSASDWAYMDILMQRSTDFGESFSTPILLAEGNDLHKTVNNPVMLEDKNGRLHFLYCEDYTVRGGRVLHRYSDDDGESFSAPVDITDACMPEYHNAFALGPGHGICTPDGTLVVPIWMVPKYHQSPLTSHAPSVVTTLYSKDMGESWTLGELLYSNKDIINPNESVAAVTEDGRVYLNIRIAGYCRAVAYSDNGYSAWKDYAPDYALPDPQCFGSVASYKSKDDPYTLIFANCATKSGRTNVTVRASFDGGKTYPVSKVIDELRGGYVEVAADPKADKIYVLYEDKFGITDHLAVFNYDWLVEEKD